MTHITYYGSEKLNFEVERRQLSFSETIRIDFCDGENSFCIFLNVDQARELCAEIGDVLPRSEVIYLPGDDEDDYMDFLNRKDVLTE